MNGCVTRDDFENGDQVRDGLVWDWEASRRYFYLFTT